MKKKTWVMDKEPRVGQRQEEEKLPVRFQQLISRNDKITNSLSSLRGVAKMKDGPRRDEPLRVLREMRRTPGESFTSFHARLRAVTNPLLHATMEEVKPMREKRKSYLSHRQENRKKVKRAKKEDYSDNEGDVKSIKKDIVKFGEVAQAPPKITVTPKERIKAKSKGPLVGGVKGAADKEALRLEMIALYRANKEEHQINK